ncbi:hypothetical protein [Tropicimonas sp. S265A]|uniref:hypothetical protein n=1 Tax=Tropicimonas sp. S265A TaxID=3415134 RepID=UPI003C7D76AA
MSYVLIGLYLGLTAAVAALNAGGGLLLAFGAFILFGVLSLIGGLAFATICVLKADLMDRLKADSALNS